MRLPIGACFALFAAACGGSEFKSSASDAGSASNAETSTPGSDADVVDAAGPPPGSCKALLAARPSLKNNDGPQTIVLKGATLRVWCDMTLDGGGWTLVGRSVAGSRLGTGFGWAQDHGSVDDDGDAYSFDCVSRGIEMTELAFGAYTSAKKWGPNVFKMNTPANFLTSYQTTSVQVPGGPQTLLGTCAPNGGPSMLTWIGETANDDNFHFRDNNAPGGFGLFSDGWNTNGMGSLGTCSYTGQISGLQGMIAIR
jgi:hypothetical protein